MSTVIVTKCPISFLAPPTFLTGLWGRPLQSAHIYYHTICGLCLNFSNLRSRSHMSTDLDRYSSCKSILGMENQRFILLIIWYYILEANSDRGCIMPCKLCQLTLVCIQLIVTFLQSLYLQSVVFLL